MTLIKVNGRLQSKEKKMGATINKLAVEKKIMFLEKASIRSLVLLSINVTDDI